MNTITKAWYRIYQFCFCIGKYFINWRQPRLAEGPESIARFALAIKVRDVEKLFIVTGRTVRKTEAFGTLCASLEENGTGYVIYDGVLPDPTTDNVEEALRTYKENGCDALLAFGGGSNMDCAKALGARVANPGKSLGDMAGLCKVGRNIPCFFAVPTTAGTGSETTVAAVITDAATHHKYAINDPHLIPRYAVLDPMVTVGLPPSITAATGLDALTHAVEAYTNRFSGATADMAEYAVKLIFQSLPAAYKNGGDLEARTNMLKASFLAGAAFTRSCVGYVHAIAHTIGGLYHIPHGLANAVILPAVMELYGSSAYAPLARLADIVGIPGADRAAKAKAFIAAIYKMNADMGIPRGFDCIRDEDIPQMVQWAMAEANPVYPCPQIWGEQELRTAIEKIRL